MAKNIILYILVLLLHCACVDKRSNDGIEKELIYITKTDTIYVQVEIDSTMGQKYEAALRKYIGTREETGNNDGATIKQILLNCGIDVPAPWCACYLNQGLIDIGLHGPEYQPAFTPRWFEDARRIKWVRDRDSYKTTFEKGWIGGIYFRNLKRIAHVACILEDFGDGYVLTIEGNTNSSGGREGNGVFLRIRNKSEFYMMSDWLMSV